MPFCPCKRCRPKNMTFKDALRIAREIKERAKLEAAKKGLRSPA